MSKVVIYTAIYGDMDDLVSQPEFPDTDFICFSDKPLRRDQWQVRQRAPRYNNPRLDAKYYKMFPHRVLWRYPVSIWIDGQIQITSTAFVRQCLKSLADRSIALLRHPVRDNIFSEAAVLSEIPRFAGLGFAQQVEHYRQQGYHGTELYASTLLVRRHRRRSMRRFGRAWMEENLRWTFRDQLSLPYLTWLMDICPSIIPYNLSDNPLFRLNPHLRDQ